MTTADEVAGVARGRATTIRWVAGAVVLAVAVLGAVFAAFTDRDPTLAPSALLGRAAPAFSLPPLDPPAEGAAAPVSLAAMRGEIVVVNFWASWCVPCRAEHAALTEAAGTYRDDGVRFVGIVHEDSPGDARRFLDRLGRSYPSVLDPGSRTAIDFGLRGVPETFFVDRDGVVVGNVVGPVDVDVLTRTLDAMLLGRRPGSTKTGEVETGPQT